MDFIQNLPKIEEEEEYKKVEKRIRQYLEVQFNKAWKNYELDSIDIFDSDELFGGVPDGEELDEKGEVCSILEIKTVNDTKWKKEFSGKFDDAGFSQVLSAYCLQISLYLHLRHIDLGYICICCLKEENWQRIESIKLDSKFTKDDSFIPIKSSEQLHSGIEEIGVCEYECEILEVYRNNFANDNETLVFKIKVNLEKYRKLLDKLSKGFETYKENSPTMTDNELSTMSGKIAASEKGFD